LLQGAALMAAPPPRGRTLAFVASYSSPQGPEGSHGNGKGIYLFEMDPASGKLEPREIFPSDANPSWLAFNPARTHLYSANETAEGTVSAWAVDGASGRLKLLNTVSSQGAGPTHLSVHPAGGHVLVANYYGGTAAVLPLRASGELGDASDVQRDTGTVGPASASSAPAGSFAISGHDKPHAHMIQPDPAGRFVLAADLGLDRILVWRFDAEGGRLMPNDPPFVALPAGDGPRHFAFHPNGKWLYSLQEEASTLVTFDYDPERGRLKAVQSISTLPKGFVGTNFTSEVIVSADGRFVYAANRLHDSIAWFAVSPTGTLTWTGEEWTRGDYPRSFNIDPSGNFLYSCNQRGDAVATFRVNRKTGGLSFTGQYTAVGTPSAIVFLTRPGR
jgi:6-phosphogluconolactonase (cycloisomerase 2 family)